MPGRHRKPPSRAAGRHRRPPGPARWVAPGLVAVAVLGAGGVAAHAALTDSGSDPGADSVQLPSILPRSAPTSPGAVPGLSPPATPGPTVASSAPEPTASHHRVVALRLVVVRGISWVQVRRPAGRVLVSGILHHGRHLSYSHGPLDVVIGNAGAVRVIRHGHAQPPGHPGAVLRFRVR